MRKDVPPRFLSMTDVKAGVRIEVYHKCEIGLVIGVTFILRMNLLLQAEVHRMSGI